MDRRRDLSWSRIGVRAAACAALTLFNACGAPAPPPSSTVPAGEDPRVSAPAASETATPPGAPAPPDRSDAPPPVPAAGAEATMAGGGVRPPATSLAELAEHALAKSAYGAEDPARCGLRGPGASPPSSVQVVFGCTPANGPVVAAVPARAVPVPAGSRPERVALAALLAGPTAEERRAGYVSNFGDASKGVAFEVEIRPDGMAVANFDQAVRSEARAFVSPLDARQVVATLGQFPGVQRVLILVEGEPLCKALGEC